MNTKKFIVMNFKYLKYLTKHRWFVFVECCKMGIIWRGLVHDLSKYSLSEWNAYLQAFYGDDGYAYYKIYPKKDAPPNKVLKHTQVMDAFDRAWLHHQHKNPHHYQYYILREDSGKTKCLDMPDVYIKEMFSDWVGAGRAIVGKDSDVTKWYLENKKNIMLSSTTRYKIEVMMAIKYVKSAKSSRFTKLVNVLQTFWYYLLRANLSRRGNG